MPSNEPWRNPRPAPELGELRARVPVKSLIPPWVRAWWPALLWAIVLFTGSTDSFSSDNTSHIVVPLLRWLLPFLQAEQLEYAHHLIRKSAHFIEYFTFYLLVYRGMRAGKRGWRISWGASAWFIAAAYSVLDEVHQSFVASRTASPWDSLLDSTGAFFGLIIVFIFYRLKRVAK
jgi:VanZ family protein